MKSEAGENWRDWVGRREAARDTIDLLRARALQATLDVEGDALAEGDPLPPLWHWCYFWNLTPAAELGPDGHARRGGFLPPIDLPRRMWAGSRFRFERPIRIGSSVTRSSAIASIRETRGRSGPLAFVTVRHELADGSGTCLHEEHDIVYREAAAGPVAGGPAALPDGEPAERGAPWHREVRADPVLLFRYSALTFNGHRIHYDLPYVRDVEGYPGLIVHGPLLATLMLGLAVARSPGRAIRSFAFRVKRPVFADRIFTLCGRPEGDDGKLALWIADQDGFLTMQGEAERD